MKKLTRNLVIFLIFSLVISSFLGCSKQPNDTSSKAKETITFTDSCGRNVEVPKDIKRIAPAGGIAQMFLYSVNPDKLVGWANSPSKSTEKYIDKKYWNLPAFGQVYGKNAKLNVEALINAKPDIIIDLGEKKKTIKEDMDRVQKQVGIPVVFIEATLDNMGEAYKKLGKLIGEEKRGNELSDYTNKTINEAKEKVKSIPENKRVKVYFGEGKQGLNTNPRGSIHADVIDVVGGVNVANIPITKGTGGNEVTIEQVLLWKPDVILFGAKSVYSEMGTNKAWKDFEAVKNGKYYEVPVGPYNFMGRPPSINRLIGIKWLGNLLYPDVFKYNMVEETKKFYELFYNYKLSDKEAKELLSKSTLK